MKRAVMYLALLAVTSLPAYAQAELTLDDVLASSMQHFPKIKEAQSKQEARIGAVTQALGQFDASLDNDTAIRTSGFYSGDMTSTRVVKPLQDFNARVSGGYRISDGTFPIYNDYFETRDRGEFNLELFFSLLRDRSIDERRFRLWNSELDLTQAEREVLLEKIRVQHAAMNAYFEWLAAGQNLDVFRDLVELAQERQKALNERAKRGDIAKITATENLQALYRRQGQMNDAERVFANAANNLSLYLRDERGDPLIPKPEQVLHKFPPPEKTIKDDVSNHVAEAIRLRPEFGILKAQVAQQENEVRLGENRLLPQLDVTLQGARDVGAGTTSRGGTESIVGLNFSYPLQTRLGEGQASKARANLRALGYEKRLLTERITQQVGNIVNDINANRRFIDFTDKEVSVARKMQTSEKELFNEGASDFFVLNMREEQLGNARIQHVLAQLNYFRSLANYYAATVKSDALMIE